MIRSLSSIPGAVWCVALVFVVVGVRSVVDLVVGLPEVLSVNLGLLLLPLGIGLLMRQLWAWRLSLAALVVMGVVVLVLAVLTGWAAEEPRIPLMVFGTEVAGLTLPVALGVVVSAGLALAALGVGYWLLRRERTWFASRQALAV